MAIINGTAGNDLPPTLDGTADADTINGLGGNDTINGNGGNDIINGGTGIDTHNGGDGDDLFVLDTLTGATETFDGGAGTDTIELRAHPGPLVSQFGPLSLHLFQSANSLVSVERMVFASQVGQTVLGLSLYSNVAASGLTELVAGAGRDIISFGVTGAGAFTVPVLTYTNWSVVPVNAWLADDSSADAIGLSASAAGNTLNAAAGLNIVQFLSGGAGNDILNGSANGDVLNGGVGNDQLFGNGGNDSLALSNVATRIAGTNNYNPPSELTGAGSTFDGGDGTDVLTIGGSVNFQGTLSNIEGVNLLPAYSPAFPDPYNQARRDAAVLELDSAHRAMLPGNAFFRGTGSVIFVIDDGLSASVPTYTVESGSSVIFGIQGGVGDGLTFTGSAGDDIIRFGSGIQTATGGGGADRFRIGLVQGTVTDFTLGTDKIDFSGTDLFTISRVRDIMTQGANGTVIGGDTPDGHYEMVLQGVSLASIQNSDILLGSANLGSVNETGSALGDVMFAGSANDVIHGADGNDRIYGGGGIDQLFGDAGDDVLILDGATAVNGIYDGGAGNDAILVRTFSGALSVHTVQNGAQQGIVSIETLRFGSFVGGDISVVTTAEQFAGSGLTGVVGGGGRDLLYFDMTSAGTFTVPVLTLSNWTNGTDGLVVRVAAAVTGDVTINARDNLATGQFLNGGVGNDTINGSNAADTLIGGNGADTLVGNAGNNSLRGDAGADQMFGGTGNDSYFTDVQNDIVFEDTGGGIDLVTTTAGYYLFAEVENLTLASGAGGIFGVGNELANALSGNESANLLIAGAGDDIVHGNLGNDVIFGQDGADQLFGEAGSDYFAGGLGNDTIRGDGDGDILYGEDGADQLFGDAGGDFLAAGTGNDTADGGADSDEIYGEDGDDTLTGGASFDFDILVGGDGNDVLRGDSTLGDFDYLYGNAGNDTFYVDTPFDLEFEQPGEGTDTVFANIVGAGFYLHGNVENLTLLGDTPFGVGNDLANTLTGNAIGNFLLGGADNDTLNGKGGGDVLFGEAGADTFVFEAGTGGDVIGDFAAGSDKIQISGIFADFAAAQANFIQNGNVGAINLGNGDFIVLHNVTMSQLTATDFLFG